MRTAAVLSIFWLLTFNGPIYVAGSPIPPRQVLELSARTPSNNGSPHTAWRVKRGMFDNKPKKKKTSGGQGSKKTEEKASSSGKAKAKSSNCASSVKLWRKLEDAKGAKDQAEFKKLVMGRLAEYKEAIAKLPDTELRAATGLNTGVRERKAHPHTFADIGPGFPLPGEPTSLDDAMVRTMARFFRAVHQVAGAKEAEDLLEDARKRFDFWMDSRIDDQALHLKVWTAEKMLKELKAPYPPPADPHANKPHCVDAKKRYDDWMAHYSWFQSSMTYRTQADSHPWITVQSIPWQVLDQPTSLKVLEDEEIVKKKVTAFMKYFHQYFQECADPNDWTRFSRQLMIWVHPNKWTDDKARLIVPGSMTLEKLKDANKLVCIQDQGKIAKDEPTKFSAAKDMDVSGKGPASGSKAPKSGSSRSKPARKPSTAQSKSKKPEPAPKSKSKPTPKTAPQPEPESSSSSSESEAESEAESSSAGESSSNEDSDEYEVSGDEHHGGHGGHGGHGAQPGAGTHASESGSGYTYSVPTENINWAKSPGPVQYSKSYGPGDVKYSKKYGPEDVRYAKY